MITRLFSRQIPPARDLYVLPIVAKNICQFGKYMSVAENNRPKENVRPDTYLHIQIDANGGLRNYTIDGPGIDQNKIDSVLELIKHRLYTQSVNPKEILKSSSKSKKMSFDEFIHSNRIESYEEYKKDPEVLKGAESDEKKLQDGYKGYCLTMYGDYLNSIEEGNIFTAL